ncbi:hypothetical protein DINM_002330 [Dirofilaria immitis]|nr:hypothetical protein [Dirofilaria immitis]
MLPNNHPKTSSRNCATHDPPPHILNLKKAYSAITRTLENGYLFCIICNTQVKSKLWIAHSNGRKHRENVANFKNNYLTAGMVNATSSKRNPEESITSLSTVPLKKLRDDGKESTSNEIAPWEKDPMLVVMETNAKYSQKKNVIKGVPEGFFEDETLNSREEEHREENEENVVAIEHDIELINEQIDQWKRVNRLELRRDELYNLVAEKNGRYSEPVAVEQMSDDDSDVDLTGWRNKGI